MAVIRLAGFLGENRSLHPTLLPDVVGTSSINQKPGYGDLRPWNAPAATGITVAPGTQTIFRMNRTVASDTQHWLRWPNVVHTVLGPNSGDTAERTYYTGDGEPKWTDLTKAIAGAAYPNSYRLLGVPAPASAPLLSSTSNADADIGKYRIKLESFTVTALAAGSVYRIKVGDAAYQTITVSDSGNGFATTTSLATQLAALTGVTAVAVTASGDETAGVEITSDNVGESFTLEKRYEIDTTPDYDPDVVTYTTLQNLTGTAGTPASYTIAETWINETNAAVGSRWAFTVNAAPAVSVTLVAGAGTFPPRVNATSLFDVLKDIPGLTVTLGTAGNGVDKVITVSTIATGTSATLLVQRINPSTSGTDRFTTVATAYAVTDTREAQLVYYVYTFVTDAGEESAPSPVSSGITIRSGDTVTLTSLGPVPSGAYGINRIRVYRTQTGSASTEFYFLAEVVSTTTTLNDTGQTLGEVLPTATWVTPPSDLSHLTAMWNGMMAGISGRSVRVCEAYVPYAWPLAYEILPSNTNPVALGVYGQNLVVLTNGNPIIVTGGSPDALDEQPIDFLQACIAPRSVVSMGSGVAWASPDGLAYVGAGGTRLLTASFLTRAEWQALNPSSIVGCVFENRYYGTYAVASVTKMFMVDPQNPQGMYFMDFGATSFYVDPLQDVMYVLDGTAIKKWDSGAALTCSFKSKLFSLPRPVQAMSVAHVRANSYPVTFKLYADGALKHTATVSNGNPFRLPGGYHASEFQIEVSGTSPIQSAAAAHSVEELKSV